MQNAAIRRLVHTADTWSRNETSYMNGTKNLLILVFTKVLVYKIQDYYYEGTDQAIIRYFYIPSYVSFEGIDR